MVKDSLCGKVNSMTSGLFHPRSFGGNVRVVREDIFHLKYMQLEGRCFEKMTRDFWGKGWKINICSYGWNKNKECTEYYRLWRY